MQVSIIGCGNIGKLLAQRLIGQSVPLAACASSVSSLDECNALHIPCTRIELDKAVEEMDLSGHRMIYFVPPPRVGAEDTRMANFLRAIELHPPERFVLISTTGVYGNCAGRWVDEMAPLNPQTDRARRRVDAERKAQRFCRTHGIPLVILRVPGIYGPGRVPVERIRSGEPIVRREDSPFTNRIHAGDLVTICEIALSDTRITGIYNAADGHPSTMYDYFTGIAKALKLPEPPAISLEEAQQRLSPGMLSYLSESRRIDNTRLLHDFGIDLQYPDLEAGLGTLE